MKSNVLFEEFKDETPLIKNSYYKKLFNKLLKKPSFIVSVLIVLIIFITGMIVNYTINKDSYMLINFDKSFISPNSKYLFGTNEFGQNVFYQVFVGSYNTIKLAILATLINLIIGSIIGIIWGHSSKFDFLFIFIKSIIDNIPLNFFYIIIITFLGDGFIPLLLVIALFSWINTACLIRNNLLITRSKDYNVYSKLNKTPLRKIAFFNYLPSLLPVIFNSIAISIPEIISFEITISYFGFSLGENNLSLGRLLYNSISKNNYFSHPYLFLIPLIFLFIINFCFFKIGKTFSSVSNKEDF